MLAFLEYLDESRKMSEFKMAKSKKVVFAFGRFNPISNGHEKLIKKVESVAKKEKADGLIFTSHSQDAKKNPLTYEQKLKYLSELESKNLFVIETKAKQVFQVLEDLSEKGYEEAIFVVGSDRVPEFSGKFDKYLKDYNINSIKVISAGERDPDAEGVAGISGTKLRQFVLDDNFEDFKKNVPFKENVAKQMFDDVAKNMK